MLGVLAAKKWSMIPSVLYGGVFLAFVGIAISTIHFNSFYYRHDVPKWMVFDIGVSIFIFYSVLKGKGDELKIGALGLVNVVLIVLMSFSLIWAPNIYAGFEKKNKDSRLIRKNKHSSSVMCAY